MVVIYSQHTHTHSNRAKHFLQFLNVWGRITITFHFHSYINQLQSPELNVPHFLTTHPLCSCRKNVNTNTIWDTEAQLKFNQVLAKWWKEGLGHVGVVPLLESRERSLSTIMNHTRKAGLPGEIWSTAARWTWRTVTWLKSFSLHPLKRQIVWEYKTIRWALFSLRSPFVSYLQGCL